MGFDRKKFIDETTGDLGAAFDIIDGLISTLEYYIATDECSNGYGSGCFYDPLGEIESVLKNNKIDEYISFV